MLKILSTVIISIFISSCDLNDKKPNKSIKDLIVGTWAEFYDHDGKITIYATYLDDGIYNTFGYIPPENKEYVFASGKWWLEDNQSCVELSLSSHPVFEQGFKSCVDIISIDSDKFIFEIEGNKTIMKRVTNGYL